jgi:hypothetical protein
MGPVSLFIRWLLYGFPGRLKHIFQNRESGPIKPHTGSGLNILEILYIFLLLSFSSNSEF